MIILLLQVIIIVKHLFFTDLNDVVTVPTSTDFDNYIKHFTSYSDKDLNNISIDINTQSVFGPSKIHLASNDFTSYKNNDMDNIKSMEFNSISIWTI